MLNWTNYASSHEEEDQEQPTKPTALPSKPSSSSSSLFSFLPKSKPQFRLSSNPFCNLNKPKQNHLFWIWQHVLALGGHCLSILVQFWGVLKSGFTCPLQEQLLQKMNCWEYVSFDVKLNLITEIGIVIDFVCILCRKWSIGIDFVCLKQQMCLFFVDWFLHLVLGFSMNL